MGGLESTIVSVPAAAAEAKPSERGNRLHREVGIGAQAALTPPGDRQA
jgi:hypothetical protein